MAARVAITSVEGLLFQGVLSFLILEIEVEGTDHVLLSLQGKRRKPNIIRKVSPGRNRLVIERELVDAAQCHCGGEMTVRVYALADASVSDQWIGKLICSPIAEEVEGPRVSEEEKAAGPIRDAEGAVKEEALFFPSLPKEIGEAAVEEGIGEDIVEPEWDLIASIEGKVSKEEDRDEERDKEKADALGTTEVWPWTTETEPISEEMKGQERPLSEEEQGKGVEAEKFEEAVLEERRGEGTDQKEAEPIEFVEPLGQEVGPSLNKESVEEKRPVTTEEQESKERERDHLAPKEGDTFTPTIEIRRVEGYAENGEIMEIQVEGLAVGCKSIFLKVEWGKVKYFQIVFPSQGRFHASFDRRILRPAATASVDRLAVTALSTSDSSIWDIWTAKPRWLEKVERREPAFFETASISHIPSGQERLSNEPIQEGPAAGRFQKEIWEEEKEIDRPSPLPTVIISGVTGFTYQGRVLGIMIEGLAEGCNGLFVRLQVEEVKFFQKVKVPPRKFKIFFDHEMIRNRIPETFDEIEITAVALAQPKVSDSWKGRVTWKEEGEKGENGSPSAETRD